MAISPPGTPPATLSDEGRPLHIPALDGLRGVAILLVLYLHLFAGLSGDGLVRLFRGTASLGQVGVDLFFVLSGFLITRILINSKGKKGYFINFYGRRSVRIFPLYFGALIVYFIVWPLASGNTVAPLSEQAWYWFYANNIAYTFGIPLPGPNHFWSLAVEEHFYLVWPLLVAALPLKQLKRASYAIVAIAIGTRFLLLEADYGVFYFTLSRVDALALGCLLAVWERGGQLASKRRAFAVGGPVLALVLGVLWVSVSGGGLDVVQLTKFTLVAMVFACLIGTILLSQPTSILNRALSHPALRFTGTISYGLYVIHPFVFNAVLHHDLPGGIVLKCIVAVSAAYAISYVVYRLYEMPFLSLKKHFQYNSKPQPAMPAI